MSNFGPRKKREIYRGEQHSGSVVPLFSLNFNFHKFVQFGFFYLHLIENFTLGVVIEVYFFDRRSLTTHFWQKKNILGVK